MHFDPKRSSDIDAIISPVKIIIIMRWINQILNCWPESRNTIYGCNDYDSGHFVSLPSIATTLTTLCQAMDGSPSSMVIGSRLDASYYSIADELR
ncbi:hypothetical protein BV898_14473 [Hypsibius exemplaris]|uniref:Uncharacterized protein n=1 Tax=Hypsibius exemplaris TaxID=2072580 RepID=A0A9X6RJJ0_HYPEX|nr:hypothetical protein BV898_14473 [Hypsibius exemplaris]